MQATEATSSLLELSFNDWDGTRKAELEGVSGNTTIGEALTEAVRALGLPMQTFYQAFRGDRRLNVADCLSL